MYSWPLLPQCSTTARNEYSIQSMLTFDSDTSLQQVILLCCRALITVRKLEPFAKVKVMICTQTRPQKWSLEGCTACMGWGHHQHVVPAQVTHQQSLNLQAQALKMEVWWCVWNNKLPQTECSEPSQLIGHHQREKQNKCESFAATKNSLSYSSMEQFQDHGNLQQLCEAIFHSKPRTPGEPFEVPAK